MREVDPAQPPRRARSTDGEVWLDGERIDGLSETDLARLSPQGRIRVPVLQPGADAVHGRERRAAAPRRPPAERRTSVRERAAGRSRHFGKHGAAPGQLSGGNSNGLRWHERSRTGLTWYVDEPTGSLDSAATRGVLGREAGGAADAAARHARRERRLGGGPGDHAPRRARCRRDGAGCGSPGHSSARAGEPE